MTISNCNGLCWRDADTGEIFCPACRGWVYDSDNGDWLCPECAVENAMDEEGADE